MLVESPDCFQGCDCEADTLIAFHASTAMANILLRASDTDVVVVLIGMIGREQHNSAMTAGQRHIIMDCINVNSRRLMDVSNIVSALESKQVGLATALPAMHALTACDYISLLQKRQSETFKHSGK